MDKTNFRIGVQTSIGSCCNKPHGCNMPLEGCIWKKKRMQPAPRQWLCEQCQKWVLADEPCPDCGGVEPTPNGGTA